MTTPDPTHRRRRRSHASTDARPAAPSSGTAPGHFGSRGTPAARRAAAVTRPSALPLAPRHGRPGGRAWLPVALTGVLTAVLTLVCCAVALTRGGAPAAPAGAAWADAAGAPGAGLATTGALMPSPGTETGDGVTDDESALAGAEASGASPAAAGTTPTPAGTAELSAIASEVSQELNAQRTQAGLTGLDVSDCLGGQAASRVTQLVAEQQFDNLPMNPVAAACGATSAAENLYLGDPSATEVLTAWMGADDHKANVLGSYTAVGVACAADAERVLCSAVFTATS